MPLSNAADIAVLVPTYRRPRDLERCLRALQAQVFHASQILVVARRDDRESWDVLDAFARDMPALQGVVVDSPGLVHALNSGIVRVRTPLLAVTDDDAAPRPDWLKRIVAHFEAEGAVAGVGGRDWIHRGDAIEEGRASVVGKLPSIGSQVGNHHLGFGAARYVDVIKGANCAYRIEPLRAGGGFDERLRGSGAQAYSEIGVGLRLKKAGWRLIYDPRVAVDHYLGIVFGEDVHRAGKFVAAVQRNEAHNEGLARLEFLKPELRPLFIAWALLVGTRANPGLIQGFRFLLRDGWRSLERTLSAALGYLVAFRPVGLRSSTGPPPLIQLSDFEPAAR
ncbi:MAG: glycosyltransferase [Candidatus Eremiobacteraeota bacterium]|nr:glycosyltransferase [Candidatus Eremiobacteraeota bacterium]